MLTACIVTEASHGAEETPVVRATTPTQMWNLVGNGITFGSVVLFESSTDSFFSVRNEWQQDVGMIDAMGRAWAFQPHQKEAQWVGSGSVVSGAARILGVEGEPELQDAPLPDSGAPVSQIIGPQTD